MEYKVYKLEFQGPVHFGKGSLEDSEYTFCADTLFSALCQEASKKGEAVLTKLYEYAKTDALLLSDAFPYQDDMLYLPKPMCRIEPKEDAGDSSIKKAYKKLKYILAEDMEDYLCGEYDIQYAPDMNQIGVFDMKTAASLRGEEESVPYRIRTFSFQPDSGLYIIVGYQDKKVKELLEELLHGLAFSGLGGKRSSGFGRFQVLEETLPDCIYKRLTGTGRKYMTLSVSLPRDEELEQVLEKSEYLLVKRSGFVQSTSYAKEQMRKRDLYVFKTGSCVHVKYKGDIYDVSDTVGSHAVFRYAKPMFMEVDV